jgi:hypothetical protein
MKSIPPFVNRDGNIYVHNQAGGSITLQFYDASGVARNMTGGVVHFKTDAMAPIVLTNGTQQNEKILTITPGQLSVMLQQKHQFIVVDESVSPPEPVWIGTIMVAGW